MYIAFTVNNYTKGNSFTKSYLNTAVFYRFIENNKHEYLFEVQDGNEKRVEFLEKVLNYKAERPTLYNIKNNAYGEVINNLPVLSIETIPYEKYYKESYKDIAVLGWDGVNKEGADVLKIRHIDNCGEYAIGVSYFVKDLTELERVG